MMEINKKIVSLALLAALGISTPMFGMKKEKNNMPPSQYDLSLMDNNYSYERKNIKEEVEQEFTKKYPHVDSDVLKEKIDQEVEDRIKLGITNTINNTGKNPNKNIFKDDVTISQELADELGAQLRVACESNDLETAQNLINRGANVEYRCKKPKPDYKFRDCTSALRCAIENQNTFMIKLLLDNKAKVKSTDIFRACAKHNVEILKLLLATKQASITQEVLNENLQTECAYYNPEDNSFEIIQLFIAYGAKPSTLYALGDIIKKAVEFKNSWSTDSLKNAHDLIRLFLKMNAPVNKDALAAIFTAPQELQDIFFSAEKINVTENQINAFLHNYKYKTLNDESLYLRMKYISFNREIEYLKNSKIPYDEKAMKKYLIKTIYEEDEALKAFLYKLACLSGVTPTNFTYQHQRSIRGIMISFNDYFPLFKDKEDERNAGPLSIFFRQINDNELTKDGIEILKQDTFPRYTFLSAAALGHSKIIHRIVDNKSELLQKTFFISDEDLMLKGLFSEKYGVALDEQQSVFNRSFQAAVVNNQLESAKILISLCNVSDDEKFNLVKKNIDSLSDMKKSLEEHHESKVKNESDISKKYDLRLFGDKELLNFEEMKHELTLHLCKMRSFIKALKSAGVPTEIAMHMIQYSPDCVQRLPIKQAKKIVKKPQQKLITDFFKPKKKD